MSYVVCFLFSKCRRKVYLILKQKPLWQKGRWNGIGGKIEEGETPQDACIREVKEECGLDISLNKSNNVCSLYVADGRGTQVFFFRYFLASYQIPITIEEEQVFPWDINNLPENMIINLHWLIPMALIDNENYYQIEEELSR